MEHSDGSLLLTFNFLIISFKIIGSSHFQSLHLKLHNLVINTHLHKQTKTKKKLSVKQLRI